VYRKKNFKRGTLHGLFVPCSKTSDGMLLCEGIQKGSTYTIGKDESHYLSHVLRKQVGDRIEICDGQGSMFSAEIISIRKKEVQVQVLELLISKENPESLLHIAIAPTKNINRFEWFLEKACEIGIGSITPVLCERSERKHIKPQRFERILEAAMKQSRHLYKPKLNELTPFSDVLKLDNSSQKFIAFCENLPTEHLIHHLQPEKALTVLIGPEGDFSEEEFLEAQKQGYIPVNLGQSRLRTETAGIAVAQMVEIKRALNLRG
jgi:16S rRNA (uracil1498-N3)-methyltransferase